jgi:RNA-binding protein 5/10
LKAFGPVNAVRLIRNKQTGEPKGFAFVDFLAIEDAMNLMAYQNKTLFIDGRTVQLDYSTTPPPSHSSSSGGGSGSGGGGGGGGFKDWICPQCAVTNFARRNACFSCNVPKPANPTLAPQQHQHIGDTPSNSLIVKGLSASSSDESVCAYYIGGALFAIAF